jgi:tetratricopeptide (TPR) repeat protein
MPVKKILPFIGTIAALALIAFGVSYYQDQTKVDAGPVEYVLVPVQDGSYTGELPPLTNDVTMSPTLPEEAQKLLRTKISDDVERLEDVPWDGNTWMDLAVRYHTADDFDRARVVWEFVTDVSPTNVTALNNLGRLYHFELKDFAKAEEYFNKALVANGDRVETYMELFDLYRYSYKKDTTAAVDIMKQARERFPEDINIPLTLGSHYRDIGKTGAARTQFELALTMARANNDVALMQNITTELARLP